MEYKYQQFHLKSGQIIKNQQGAVMVILAAGMVALLAVAGLALDGGNLFLNKSKLQNAIDASALSAGAALNKAGGNYQKAVDSAKTRFESVIATSGNEALLEAYNSSEIVLTVTTSPTLSPFVGSNADDDWYVRVAASALQLDSFFLRVIGIDTLSVPATAVAGRTTVGVSETSGDGSVPLICGVAPMMVCGNPLDVPDPNDPFVLPADDSEDPPTFWGYTLEEPVVLKSTANCQAIADDGTTCLGAADEGAWEVGTGNFQLIQLKDVDGNPLTGGAGIRDAMAGNLSCVTASTEEKIPTVTGNTVGPVVQGLNTRFGIYAGPMNSASAKADYLSDYVPGEPRGIEMSYETYQGVYSNDDYMLGCSDVNGCEDNRRVVAIPIGDCTNSTNGQGDVPLLAMGCFFITQKAEQQGNESSVYGQFVADCPVSLEPPPDEDSTENNTSTPSGGNTNKAYIIQLYKNPNSRDS